MLPRQLMNITTHLFSYRGTLKTSPIKADNKHDGGLLNMVSSYELLTLNLTKMVRGITLSKDMINSNSQIFSTVVSNELQNTIYK